MSATGTWTRPSADVGSPSGGRAALVAALAIGLCAAGAVVGVGPVVLLVLAAAMVATVLVAAAVLRFEWFVLGLLVIRSSVDVLKTSYSFPVDVASGLGGLLIVVSAAWLFVNRPTAQPATFHDTGTVRPRPSLLTVGVVTFTLATIISVLPSEDTVFTATEVARLVAGALLYLAVKQLLDQGMPFRRLVAALMASAAVPLLAPFFGPAVGMRTTHVKEQDLTGLRSTFVLANNFAYFLIPVILVAMASIRYVRGWQRWMLVAVVLVGSYELALTSTRGAWIGLAAGIVVIGAIDNRKLGLVALVLGVLALTFVPTVRDRFASLGDDPDSPRTVSSLAWRFDHWAEIVHLPEDNPVTGIGLGMTSKLSTNQKQPHNDYLLAYVETGYFGLLAYLALVVGFIVTSIRALVRSATPQARGLAVGILAVALAFAVGSVAENLIASAAMLWYVLPLAAYVDWLSRRPPDPVVTSVGVDAAGTRPGAAV